MFSCSSACQLTKKGDSLRVWRLQPLGPVGRGQEEAAWYIRARCWRGVQCMRALAGLSVASRSEDRLGTAQLSEPSIGARFCTTMAHGLKRLAAATVNAPVCI